MPDENKKRERGSPLSPAETARLTDQLASLTRAGLPLGPGLLALGQELPNGRLQQSLSEIAQALGEGASLDEAINGQKEKLPPHLRGLVTGGLRSGRLSDILGRFAGYANIGADLNRKLWLSMAYPILSIMVALTLFVFVNLVLVRNFDDMFRDFGVPLPRMTIGMLMISRGLRAGWPVLALVSGAILVLWLLARLFLSRQLRGSIATRLPVVGNVWKYLSWAEFCHMLGLMLETQLPLPEALRLTGEAVQNADLRAACVSMVQQIEQGTALSEAISPHAGRPAVLPDSTRTDDNSTASPGPSAVQAAADRPLISSTSLLTSLWRDPISTRRALPTGLDRLLQWAKSESAAAEILHMAGEMYEARARTQATFAGTVMAVLAVIVVLWGVCAVIVGLMLPLVTLISALSG
jgi:type II secretory pathway component PulF